MRLGAFNRSVPISDHVHFLHTLTEWSDFLDAFAWIKANTRPTDIIAGYFDSMIFLYTDRQAFRPLVVTPASPYYGITIPAVTPDELFRYLKADRGRYVLCTPFDRFSGETSLRQMIEEIHRTHPDSVELAYVGKDQRFAIYRIFTPGCGSSHPNGADPVLQGTKESL